MKYISDNGLIFNSIEECREADAAFKEAQEKKNIKKKEADAQVTKTKEAWQAAEKQWEEARKKARDIRKKAEDEALECLRKAAKVKEEAYVAHMKAVKAAAGAPTKKEDSDDTTNGLVDSVMSILDLFGLI